MPTSYEWTSGVARVNVEIKIPEAKSYLNKSDDNKYVSSTFERTGGQKRQVSVTNSVLLYSSGGGKSCRSIKIDKQSNSEKVSLKLGGPNHTDQSTTITDMVSFDNYTAVCDSSGTMTIISSPASKTTNTIKHPGDKNDFFKLTQWIGASQLYLLSLSSSNIIYEIGIKPTSSVISTGIEAVTFTAKQCDISDVTTVALLSSDQSHVKIATKTQNGWETVLTTPDLHDGDVICAIQWMGDHLVTMSGGRIVSLRFWLYTPGKELTLSLSSEYELPFNTCHATDGIISGDGGNRAIVYWPGHEVSQISIELISPGVVKFWRVDADDLLEVYVTSNSSSSSSPTNISNGEKPTHIVALFADSLCRTEWEWTQSAAAKLVPKPFNPMYIPTVIPSPDFESDNAQSRILRELGSLKASVLTMDANCRLLSVVSDRLSNVTVKDNEMTKAGLDIPKKYSSMLEESLRCTKKLNVGATADIVSTVRDNIEQAKESLVNKQTDTLMKVVKEITAEQGLQSLEEFNQNVFSKVLAPEVRGLRHLNQSTVRTLIKSEYATIQELEKKVIHLADEFQMRILTEYVTQADDLTRGIITTVDGYTNSTKQMIGEACLPINNSLRDMGLSMGWLNLESDFTALHTTQKELIKEIERSYQEEKLLREDSILPEDSISFMCEQAPQQAPERSKWENYIAMEEYNKCVYEINDLAHRDEVYDMEMEWFRDRTFKIKEQVIEMLTIESKVMLMRDAAVSIESSSDYTSVNHISWIVLIGLDIDISDVHSSSCSDTLITTLQWVSDIISMSLPHAEGDLLDDLEMVETNLQCI